MVVWVGVYSSRMTQHAPKHGSQEETSNLIQEGTEGTGQKEEAIGQKEAKDSNSQEEHQPRTFYVGRWLALA